MKSDCLKLIVGVLILLVATACYAERIDGPYKGRVIDADTGRPIQGVVVLGTWSRVTVTPGGGVSSYYDAMETVTDKKGNFTIKGLGLLVLSNVAPMNVSIFKAGYEYIGAGPWESFKVDKLLKQRIHWEGDRAIIPLRKLTKEERRKNVPSLPPGEAPLTKIILMLKEFNRNSLDLNLHPIETWGGEKI
jgi:hypothetical protein